MIEGGREGEKEREKKRMSLVSQRVDKFQYSTIDYPLSDVKVQ